MSQENVEIVRKLFDAWNAGDMAGVAELYDPDVIARAPPGWPEPGPFIGRDAVMEQYRRTRESFDRDSIELLSDFLAVADRVVVRIDWRAIGHGPQSDMKWTLIFTVREGLIFGQEYFWDHAKALEAAGLSE